jgi:tRNA (adenine37-N6)-methyltransferase
MESVKYSYIGVVRSPFKEVEGMPIQPIGAGDVKGEINLKKEYMEGLKDLEGFSHIILIYHFHLSKGYSLMVKPFLDSKKHGVFATRAPKRPNSIGMSVVRLDKIEGSKIHISHVDLVDGTPLLDIKPYVPKFDIKNGEKVVTGWVEEKEGEAANIRSDGYFSTDK